MAEIKTIASLNEKIWYRGLKTIYLLVFALTMYITIMIDRDFYEVLTAALIFEAMRRAFYYVVLGSIEPKR